MEGRGEKGIMAVSVGALSEHRAHREPSQSSYCYIPYGHTWPHHGVDIAKEHHGNTGEGGCGEERRADKQLPVCQAVDRLHHHFHWMKLPRPVDGVDT